MASPAYVNIQVPWFSYCPAVSSTHDLPVPLGSIVTIQWADPLVIDHFVVASSLVGEGVGAGVGAADGAIVGAGVGEVGCRVGI